jgi:hypothetical protein
VKIVDWLNWRSVMAPPMKVYSVTLSIDGQYVETVIVLATDWNDAEKKALAAPLQISSRSRQVMSIKRGQ